MLIVDTWDDQEMQQQLLARCRKQSIQKNIAEKLRRRFNTGALHRNTKLESIASNKSIEQE